MKTIIALLVMMSAAQASADGAAIFGTTNPFETYMPQPRARRVVPVQQPERRRVDKMCVILQYNTFCHFPTVGACQDYADQTGGICQRLSVEE